MTPSSPPRDHGGGLDAAMARYGGAREDWIDLSTGINPVAYPVPEISNAQWGELPDKAAANGLITAARSFWRVPDQASVLAANGASALIAMMPDLVQGDRVAIPGPTYNEHGAAFAARGWTVLNDVQPADALVLVHPNNPDGRLWSAAAVDWDAYKLVIIDESFCDIAPEASLIALAERANVLVLKSFGKFWGLAGLRLGFAIGPDALISRMNDRLGPWPVSGPGLAIGTAALADRDWAEQTRHRLAVDAARLDQIALGAGLTPIGGTDLFRLYDTPDGQAAQAHLARHRILGRIFPYSGTWLRLGLPGAGGWDRIEAAFAEMP